VCPGVTAIWCVTESNVVAESLSNDILCVVEELEAQKGDVIPYERYDLLNVRRLT
jgi:hypothetical protein